MWILQYYIPEVSVNLTWHRHLSLAKRLYHRPRPSRLRVAQLPLQEASTSSLVWLLIGRRPARTLTHFALQQTPRKTSCSRHHCQTHSGPQSATASPCWCHCHYSSRRSQVGQQVKVVTTFGVRLWNGSSDEATKCHSPIKSQIRPRPLQ